MLRSRKVVERIAVTCIFLVIVTAFFSLVPDKMKEAQVIADRYQQKVLLDVANYYVLEEGFQSNVADDKCLMNIYIWKKDGSPSMEEYYTIADRGWPWLANVRYKGVHIKRCFTDETGQTEQQESEKSLGEYRMSLIGEGSE